jgi:hypothetical protein
LGTSCYEDTTTSTQERAEKGRKQEEIRGFEILRITPIRNSHPNFRSAITFARDTILLAVSEFSGRYGRYLSSSGG